MQTYDNALMVGLRYSSKGVNENDAEALRRNWIHVMGADKAPVIREHSNPNTVVLERVRPRARTLRIRLIRTRCG